MSVFEIGNYIRILVARTYVALKFCRVRDSEGIELYWVNFGMLQLFA